MGSRIVRQAMVPRDDNPQTIDEKLTKNTIKFTFVEADTKHWAVIQMPNAMNGGCSERELIHEGVCVQNVPDRRPSHACTCTEACVCSSCVDVEKTCVGQTLIILTWAFGSEIEVPDIYLWRSLLNLHGSKIADAVAFEDEKMARVIGDGPHMDAFRSKNVFARSQVLGMVAAQVARGVRSYQDFKFADDPEFIKMFEFLIMMGETVGAYIPHTIDVAIMFVHMQSRRSRETAYDVAKSLPVDAPFTKIAVLEHSCHYQFQYQDLNSSRRTRNEVFTKEDNRPPRVIN